MRKLFHTTAALTVLMATSMAANAADVTALLLMRLRLRSMHLRRLVGLDFISAATLGQPGPDVT
jgi:hypothetical protein